MWSGADLTSPFVSGPAESADVRVAVGTRLVAGTLQPLYGDALVRVSYSRLAAKHRLASWVQLLALTAGRPDRAWRVVAVGRGRRSILGPVDPDWAGRVLADLVELYVTGLVEPLPLAPQTSLEYAQLRERDRSVELYLPRLEATWQRDRDSVWESFLGRDATLSTLLQEPSRPSEERGTWVEPTRFGTLARRVFTPLLRNEDLA